MDKQSPSIKQARSRIYYNSLITYTRKLKPGETIKATGYPAGLAVERSFYRLTPTATTSDGKIHFRSERITNNVITAGETVLMKVKVNTPTELPYVILEAYLPSGAEIVEDKSKEDLVNNKNDDNQSSMEGDWGGVWWTHQDVLG